MTRCPTCETELDQHTGFCSHCGKLAPPERKFYENDERKLVTNSKIGDRVLGFFSGILLLAAPSLILTLFLSLFRHFKSAGVAWSGLNRLTMSTSFQLLGPVLLIVGFFVLRKRYPEFAVGFKWLLIINVAIIIFVIAISLGILVLCFAPQLFSPHLKS